MKIRIDPLDKLFSKYIRLRAMSRVHGCERCGAWKADYKQLDCAHLPYSRKKKSTRWDEDNAYGLCKAGCHLYMDSHPLEVEGWCIEKLGQERFDLLTARERIPARYIDRSAIELYLRMKIAEVTD